MVVVSALWVERPMFEGDTPTDLGILGWYFAFPHSRRHLFFVSKQAAQNYIELAKNATFRWKGRDYQCLESGFSQERSVWFIVRRVR